MRVTIPEGWHPLLYIQTEIGSPDLRDTLRKVSQALSKLASRSRRPEISTGPISVSTVFVRVPLREFPPSRPAGSWRP
jgi:hypothetical protein